MKAKTISGASTLEILKALENAMEDGYTPTLALVFISIKQDRKAIRDVLSSKDIDVVGATSSVEFIAGQQSDGEIVLMLLDVNKNDYCILFEAIEERALSEAATQLAQNALQKFEAPAFILCTTSITESGEMLDGEKIIESIAHVIDADTPVFGGMAGDDLTFTGSYVFTNLQETDYGLTSVVFNARKIDLYGVALSGWKPLGLSKTITKSEGNLVYTFDDKPALEVYLRYLGKENAATLHHLEFFDEVGVHYPMQIERTGRDPKMCNPIGYDKEKEALIFESEVLQGSKFRFSTPPDFDIVDTVVASATVIKKESNTEADAVLIFSCAGRLSALGPLAEQENDGLAAVWNSPMAGFYTYGEFGKSPSGRHEFHSTTCSWVALKEK